MWLLLDFWYRASTRTCKYSCVPSTRLLLPLLPLAFPQDLDLKALLYEASGKGSEELLYVVPFVAKVLESCEKSRVFKPPNPWTVGILCVLGELHQQPGLKLNLKFEIEVLCKNLQTEIQVGWAKRGDTGRLGEERRGRFEWYWWL